MAVGILTACASFASVTRANDSPYRLPPFAYYQPILDRMPFGAMPVVDPLAAEGQTSATATEAEAAAEQQALANNITMSAVNITPQGHTAVGFTDRSVNPPASYYLRVGDRANGWTVKSADFDDEIATIEKDGVTITLKLGEGLVETPATAHEPVPLVARASGAPVAATVPPPVEGVAPAVKRPAQRPITALKQERNAVSEPSFADRLRERTVQKTQAQQEAEARMREQFERLARETAAREIQRRQEEEALEAEERALLEQQQQEL